MPPLVRVLFPVVVLALVVMATACGLRVVGSGLDFYEEDTEPALSIWRRATQQWDKAANDPSQESTLYLVAADSSVMIQGAIAIWDKVEPPNEAREYHQFMRQAMMFEKQGFDTMNRYYRLGRFDTPKGPNEYKELREQAMRLWIQKDQALNSAIEAAP